MCDMVIGWICTGGEGESTAPLVSPLPTLDVERILETGRGEEGESGGFSIGSASVEAGWTGLLERRNG